MNPSVALASAPEYFHLDEDLPLITAALDDLGVEVTTIDWHDPATEWSRFDLAVVRSTWDYTWQRAKFLDWARRVGRATTLRNDIDVLEWNTDKRYLLDLRGAGVPVVPTTLLEPGDRVTLPAAAEVVVKPTVSAGARDTERYGDAAREQAYEHATGLLGADRAVLVQPYLTAVDERGETGLVYAGDRYSHAFGKGPILLPGTTFVEGQYREESITARQPTSDERALAEAAIDAVARCVPGSSRRDLLYARVDVAPTATGPVVMELELVEPSLFCTYAPGSAVRFAEAIRDAAIATVTDSAVAGEPSGQARSENRRRSSKP